jgi:hypothetical protein
MKSRDARSEANQISAYVSEGTKNLFERHARATGVKKGHVVEMALLHHLQALRELPAEIIVPPRLVVTRASGEKILGRIAAPRRPTKAMRQLMGGDDRPRSSTRG